MARRIVIELGKKARRKMLRHMRGLKDAALKTRYQIVLLYNQGTGCDEAATALGCAPSTASRVARHYETMGEAGLLDGRKEPRAEKVTDDAAAALCDLLEGVPQDFGWRRTTWTRELLARALEEKLGMSFSLPTVTRLLQKVGARKGRPRPTVGCPWSKRKRQAHLRALRALVSALPKQEPVVYEDEVDIHLNPKIGADWMLRGRQKRVMTPGQNQKRYIAGTLDARQGTIHFVEAERKNSVLFIELLRHLAARAYPRARRIHMICDNYCIHRSRRVQTALREIGGRVVLHFLPPYCPDANRIERLWGDLHDNVTRNHRCATMDGLMDNVRAYLRDASPFPGSKPALAKAS
jgi:transposase